MSAQPLRDRGAHGSKQYRRSDAPKLTSISMCSGGRNTHKSDRNPYYFSLFGSCRVRPTLNFTLHSQTAFLSGITLPAILLSPYIQADDTTPTIGTLTFFTLQEHQTYFLMVEVLAAIRGLTISIGILAALTVNMLLFPQHCRVSDCLHKCSETHGALIESLPRRSL
jgi:hypothetical protein